MAMVVATHKLAIGRVRLTAAVHRAIFYRRMTVQQVGQFPKWRDRMQKTAKADANVETGIRKMSATTGLCNQAGEGPGARAARPPTHSAVLRLSPHLLLLEIL
jgi:hypothetical protein